MLHSVVDGLHQLAEDLEFELVAGGVSDIYQSGLMCPQNARPQFC